jgi:hypothetical protein
MFIASFFHGTLFDQVDKGDVSPKRLWTSTELHGVTTQKIVPFEV